MAVDFDDTDEPNRRAFGLSGPKARGHVLIASREHRWEAAIETISVDVFSRRESV